MGWLNRSLVKTSADVMSIRGMRKHAPTPAIKRLRVCIPCFKFSNPPHQWPLLYLHSGGKATTLTPLFSHSSLYIFTTSLAFSPFASRSATHFLVTSLNLSYQRSASF